ncbi:MAG: bifunctional 4-hydroxy-2-oxoglutarate aldolase/2-dehydro-3-deoxy-phosphogluconate aldolase [Pseudomonadota bacterium]
MLAEKLKSAPIVPLVQADDPDVAVKTVTALRAGGLDVIEVVLRTKGALDCLEAIAGQCPGAYVGAGTVLSLDQAEESVRRGAQFIVSPGLSDDVVAFCQSKDLDIFPGTVTAGEVQRAWNLGLRTVKFFPAGLSGGPAMVKALSSVFGGMSFMPTGGVSASNLKDYLSIPSVVACGGSWLTPQHETNAGSFDVITQLAHDALALATEARH